MSTVTDTDRLAALEEKIDVLSEQIGYLTDTSRDLGLRRAQWDDLRSELTPIVGEAFQTVTAELDDVRAFVQPSDLWRLAKKVARNTENIERMFDQVEALSDLAGEIAPLGRDAFMAALAALDEAERKGYFAFAKSGMSVVDRIVTSFSDEDVKALGDNVVLILNTVKEMTQPEVMQLLQRTAHGVRGAEVEEIGLLKLMWRMRNPAVRRGMSRMLKVLESFADPAPPGDANQNMEIERAE